MPQEPGKIRGKAIPCLSFYWREPESKSGCNASCEICRNRPSIDSWNEHFPRYRISQIVRVMNAIRQSNLFPFYFAVGNLSQKVVDAVKAGFFLVHRLDDPPGRLGYVRLFPHRF